MITVNYIYLLTHLIIYNEYLCRMALAKIKNMYIDTFTNFCCQMGPVKKKRIKREL